MSAGSYRDCAKNGNHNLGGNIKSMGGFHGKKMADGGAVDPFASDAGAGAAQNFAAREAYEAKSAPAMPQPSPGDYDQDAASAQVAARPAPEADMAPNASQIDVAADRAGAAAGAAAAKEAAPVKVTKAVKADFPSSRRNAVQKGYAAAQASNEDASDRKAAAAKAKAKDSDWKPGESGFDRTQLGKVASAGKTEGPNRFKSNSATSVAKTTSKAKEEPKDEPGDDSYTRAIRRAKP